MCRELHQELQRLREAEAEGAATTSSKFSQLIEAVGKVDRRIGNIQKLLLHHDLATSPADPRYLVDRFPPAQLYEEYLSSACALSTNDFVLPRSWISYLETELAKPTGHCLFICADFEAIDRVTEILSKDRGDGIRKLVAEMPEDLPGLVGLLMRLDPGDLLILVDRDGFVAPDLEACLANVIRSFKLEITVDKGLNARSIKFTLPHFSCYYITVNATSSTNTLSALFRREISLANLVTVHRAACIGQIAARHDLSMDYDAASKLVAAAEQLNLLPDVFAERMCHQHPDWLRELAAIRMTTEDMVGRCR
jgi:hypothetical protein